MEWRPFTSRCECRCHQASSISNPESVDVADVIAAAVACPVCLALHCPALLKTRLANEPEPAPMFRPSIAECAAYEPDGEGPES